MLSNAYYTDDEIIPTTIVISPLSIEASMSIRQKQPKPLKYSDAGVDIDAGDALIGDIAPHAKRTRRVGADSSLGGFGGLFDLKAAGFTGCFCF